MTASECKTGDRVTLGTGQTIYEVVAVIADARGSAATLKDKDGNVNMNVPVEMLIPAKKAK